jgi:hypothetical protein
MGTARLIVERRCPGAVMLAEVVEIGGEAALAHVVVPPDVRP